MNLIPSERFKASVTQFDEVSSPFISLRWYLDWMPRVPFEVYRVFEVLNRDIGLDEELGSFTRHSLYQYLADRDPISMGKTIARVKIEVNGDIGSPPIVRAVNEDGTLDEITLTVDWRGDKYSGVITAPGMTDLEITCHGRATLAVIYLWFVEDVLDTVHEGHLEPLERVGLPITKSDGVDPNTYFAERDPEGDLRARFSLAAKLNTGIDYDAFFDNRWRHEIKTDLLQALRNTDDSTEEDSFEKATIKIDDILLKVGPATLTEGASSELVLFDVLSLGAVSYSPLALTLGFGTNLPYSQGYGYSLDEAFYVVVARIDNKPYIYKPLVGPGSTYAPDIQYATIATAIHAPLVLPTNLKAESAFISRKENASKRLYQVNLNWDRPDLKPLPLSYRVVEGHDTHLTEENGPFYLPVESDQKPSDPVRYDSNPTDVESWDVETQREYRVRATDVHDRWGEEASATCIFVPPDPQIPALKGINHEYPRHYDTAEDVKTTFYIELSWTWETSAPETIEIKVVFPSDKDEHLIQLKFSNSEVSAATSTSLASVAVQPIERVRSDQDVSHNIKAYRIILHDQHIDFDNLGSSTVEVSVRAREQNRRSWSNFSEPLCYKLSDPRPAAVPDVKAKIYYTEVPDLTGWARITWPFGVVNTEIQGYAIYEASEQALLAAIVSNSERTPPDADKSKDKVQTLNDRATQLLNLHKDSKLRAVYSRKYTELVSPDEARSFQLEVPANPGRLYVFRCSTVTHANVESELSEPIFVALPTRVNPSPPRLSLEKLEGNKAHLRLRQDKPQQVGYIKLYRVQNDSLKNGSFGPARVSLDPVDLEGTIEDELLPSWKPYHYRAIAFSKGEPKEGRLASQSDASNLIVINHVLSAPPEISDVQHEHLRNKVLKVQFKVTDAGTLGKHRLTLSKVRTDTPLPVENEVIGANYETVRASPSSALRINKFSSPAGSDNLMVGLKPTWEDYPLNLVIAITDEIGRSSAEALRVLPPARMPTIDIIKVDPITHKTHGTVVTFLAREPLSQLGTTSASAQLVVTAKFEITVKAFGEIPMEKPFLPEIIDEEYIVERTFDFKFKLKDLADNDGSITQTSGAKEDEIVKSDIPAYDKLTEQELDDFPALFQALENIEVSAKFRLRDGYKAEASLIHSGSAMSRFSRYKVSVNNPYAAGLISIPQITETIKIIAFKSTSLQVENGAQVQDAVIWNVER